MVLSKSALIFVDCQNDFFEGGALAVPRSLEILPTLHKLRESGWFNVNIFTCDWHPVHHCSFKKPCCPLNENGECNEGPWPPHCVQHSVGAALHPEIKRYPNDYVVTKAYQPEIDSYSGFGVSTHPTDLKDILTHHSISTVFVVGLATDYCVMETALDAKKHGFTTIIISDGCRGITSETVDKAYERMKEQGILTTTLEELSDAITKEEKANMEKTL
uniref:nicotinamidase n=1 Tax=Nephromyces sp. MMRI TaxID=2496275 RepID=A0A3S8V3G6_9APIC|nr:peroxisomal adenine nucleotide carrier 1 [Nephromyces sp. MMRI]